MKVTAGADRYDCVREKCWSTRPSPSCSNLAPMALVEFLLRCSDPEEEGKQKKVMPESVYLLVRVPNESHGTVACLSCLADDVQCDRIGILVPTKMVVHEQQ